MPPVRHFTPEALAERWGDIKVRTLAKWRREGGGPRFLKLGGCIRYTLPDIEAYETKRGNQQISEYGPE